MTTGHIFKKQVCRALSALIITVVLTACTGQAEGTTVPLQKKQHTRPVIVTTIFPLYDWTDNILGADSDAELALLLDSGVDLHSFQPTARDVMKIATCDLFLYVGGESDEWVADALKEAVNPDLVAVNLLEALGDRAKEEEVVEGMEEDHDHDHDGQGKENGHDHEEEDLHGEEDHEEEDAHGGEDHDHGEDALHDGDEGHAHENAEFDEHIWLSLRNASFLCGVIADAVKEIDPDNAAVYDKNLASYRDALDALDTSYRETVARSDKKTLLFGDRFPFRYLTDDYGLSYYAAFAGCSAETEASFETVTFLSGKTDELNLRHVMMTEGSDGKIAQTIVKNTSAKDQKVVALNSMQSVTGQDVRDGVTYLSIMEENLEVLKEALE